MPAGIIVLDGETAFDNRPYANERICLMIVYRKSADLKYLYLGRRPREGVNLTA